MNVYRLENWELRFYAEGDEWSPPETRRLSLAGEVYGHPNWEDGHFITTSPIMRDAGPGLIKTINSVYELGNPNPEYIEHCKEKGYYIPTKEKPIKFHDYL